MTKLTNKYWAMDRRALQDLLRTVDCGVALSGDEERLEMQPLYEIDDGTAHIGIHGPIMQGVPEVFHLLGIQATDTDDVYDALTDALFNEDVEQIQFNINSPGGTLGGVQQLADEVFAARGIKPMTAEVGGMAASAAYWIASQADAVNASPTSEVGSIGVYTVVEDTSELAANAGVKAHLISSGKHKGAGAFGTEVTDDHLAVEQEMIDEAAGMFVDAVARGRGMTPKQVQPLATGRTWFGEKAAGLNLIDHVHNVPVGDPTAPDGAKEALMSKSIKEAVTTQTVQLEELQRELEVTKTERDAALKAVEAARMIRRDGILDKYADRITPAMKPHVESFAEAIGHDLGKLEEFLKAMPVALRDEPVGDTPSQPEGGTLTSGEKELLAGLGISAEDYKGVN